MVPCRRLMRLALDVLLWLVRLRVLTRHMCNLCQAIRNTGHLHQAGSKDPHLITPLLLPIRPRHLWSNTLRHSKQQPRRTTSSYNRRLCVRVASKPESVDLRKKLGWRKRRKNASARSWSLWAQHLRRSLRNRKLHRRSSPDQLRFNRGSRRTLPNKSKTPSKSFIRPNLSWRTRQPRRLRRRSSGGHL